jgi:hypothetical protein
MPNYEREISKQKLRTKLEEAQVARRSAKLTEYADSKNQGSTGTRHKKVDKKPVPNFGGGKIGTK